MKAFLILEDGTVFQGKAIGACKEVISEIVFNTSMAGYLEVLTDPSYAGQAVCMTYPLIGNYGICTEDMESAGPWLDGFIVRELSRKPSNFRSDTNIGDFLLKYDIAGIEGIDTRALTKRLRNRGTMNGMITTDASYDLPGVLVRLKEYRVAGVVDRVTCHKKYTVLGSKRPEDNEPVTGSDICRTDGRKAPSMVRKPNGAGKRVALLDFGEKNNIIRSLQKRGCDITVYPAFSKAEEILKEHPDGIMLSNGPGDPKECKEAVREIKKLYDADVPIFAICLGHQLMALAVGADTYKMKYGHRGGNHPVKDLETGKVYISSQNHGYVVDVEHLDKSIAVPAFVNVNDGTNEGLSYLGKNIFTVQFHPEACPGPQDSGYLFDRFISMMEVAKDA